MSNANVQFHLIETGDDDSFRQWGKDRSECEIGKEQTFSFSCPKYKRRCGDLIIAGRTASKRGPKESGGTAQWDWDGNRVAPTFTPSVNCIGCWHGFIRSGRCVNTGGADEPEPVGE